MYKLPAACALVCVLLLAAWASSQSSPDFSGTWEVDKGKSKNMPRNFDNVDSVTWVISQDQKQLTLESTVVVSGQQRPVQSFSYNLDGTETTAEVGGRMPGKATLKARWASDGVLELVTVRDLNIQGNEVTIKTTERWELAEDGEVLKVQRTTESPRGVDDSTLILNKK